MSSPIAIRSISVDSITNKASSQTIIVTEPITFLSSRANNADDVTIDFNQLPTATRAYTQS